MNSSSRDLRSDADAATPEEALPHHMQAYPPWRRGMMHAIERLDMVFGYKRPLPKRASDLRAMIEQARAVLDELTELQRKHTPATYEDAYAVCAADLARIGSVVAVQHEAPQ